jgi:hypothetical protein
MSGLNLRVTGVLPKFRQDVRRLGRPMKATRCAVIPLMFFTLPLLAQDVRYAPASAETTERLRAKLAEAVNTLAPLREGVLFDDVVLCGPNLWSVLRSDMLKGNWAIDMQLLTDVPERVIGWGLKPARDFEEDSEKRKVMRASEQTTGRLAFLGGAVRDDGPRAFGGLLAGRLATPSRKTVRDATLEELQYEWLWVGWDLDGPIFVVENGATRYLVDLDDGKIAWIDVLPKNLSRDE